MNKQQAKPSDVAIGTPKGPLVPLQTEPLWNGCGQPTAIHDCVIIKHRARQAVTAMHTISNQLRLFSWRVNADGTVVCTGTTEGQGEDVVQIDLARIDPIHAVRYVTACRTGGGELYLQCWDVSNTGAFYPTGPAICGATGVEWMQLLALGPERLLTIGLGRDGLWYLTTWQINIGGEMEPQQQATMPATTGALAVGLLPTQGTGLEGDLFVTAYHIAPDTLRWTIWSALPSGELVQMQSFEEHYTDIIEIAVTTVAHQLVTLLHHSDGRLYLISHALPQIHNLLMLEHTSPVDGTGNRSVAIATQATHSLATGVRQFACSRYEERLLIAYTTCAQDAQAVKLLYWPATTPEFVTASLSESLPDPAADVVELGNLPIHSAHTLALCDQPLEGYAPVLTAVGTASGGLQLTTWGWGN